MVATRRGPDVLVVGAGLAGLACARDLTRVHTDDGPLRLSDPTRGSRRLGGLRPGRLAGSRDPAADRSYGARRNSGRAAPAAAQP
ncbi:hypothetical protein ACH40F_23015 [Streptomyces sp. NPDC020794]|uniref:hypothetical protein n=1 Tax=unclassified Streptomyces TaxID=2593676 RepID=UPI0036E04C5E